MLFVLLFRLNLKSLFISTTERQYIFFLRKLNFDDESCTYTKNKYRTYIQISHTYHRMIRC